MYDPSVVAGKGRKERKKLLHPVIAANSLEMRHCGLSSHQHYLPSHACLMPSYHESLGFNMIQLSLLQLCLFFLYFLMIGILAGPPATSLWKQWLMLLPSVGRRVGIALARSTRVPRCEFVLQIFLHLESR